MNRGSFLTLSTTSYDVSVLCNHILKAREIRIWVSESARVNVNDIISYKGPLWKISANFKFFDFAVATLLKVLQSNFSAANETLFDKYGAAIEAIKEEDAKRQAAEKTIEHCRQRFDQKSPKWQAKVEWLKIFLTFKPYEVKLKMTKIIFVAKKDNVVNLSRIYLLQKNEN